MFCPNCGTKNEDDSLFCLECGSSLKAENHTAIQPESRVDEKKENPNPFYQEQINGGVNGSGYQGRQPYQNGRPNGMSGNTYYDPRYQNHQNQGTLVKQKKPVSKLAIVTGVEVVAAVALIAGTWKILNDRFSPETVAMDYWKATADCAWSEAYDYCDFPDSNLLTKKMYVEAKANSTEPLTYKSVTIRDVNQLTNDVVNQLGKITSVFGVDGDDYDDYAESLKDDDLKAYSIEYMEKGADSKSSEYITLTKTGKKKFLFWDEWKVASSDSWAQNVSYTIPEGATLSLNGEVVDESDATVEDGRKTVEIPYLFTGDYQMQVTEDGMEPYCKYTTVSAYGSEENYIDLVPSDETLTALGEQAGNDIKFIVESALQGKSFKDVQDVFAASVLESNNIKSYYEDVANKIKSGGSMQLTGLGISNMNAVLSTNPTSSEVSMQVSAVMKENYLNYWNEPDEESRDVQFYVTYRKTEDGWKLTNLPVDEYSF